MIDEKALATSQLESPQPPPYTGTAPASYSPPHNAPYPLPHDAPAYPSGDGPYGREMRSASAPLSGAQGLPAPAHPPGDAQRARSTSAPLGAGYPAPMYPPAVAPAGQRLPSAAQIGQDYQAQLFARCAQGNHSLTTKYGLCGIITAVLLFPIGLICLFIDTEQRCTRCGEVV